MRAGPRAISTLVKLQAVPLLCTSPLQRAKKPPTKPPEKPPGKPLKGPPKKPLEMGPLRKQPVQEHREIQADHPTPFQAVAVARGGVTARVTGTVAHAERADTGIVGGANSFSMCACRC